MPESTPSKAKLMPADLVGSSPKTKVSVLKDEDFSRIVNLKGTETSGNRRIMLAYEDTADAKLALDYTLKTLARPGDHVFLVTILPITLVDAAYLSYAPEYNLQEDAKWLRKMNDNALEVLKAQGAQFEDIGADVTVHVAHGDPRFSLIALADFHDVNLIVIGRRKLGRFQKLITSGSVSQYVLTHANQNVLIVKE
nr:universal stress protein A [Phaffia rhodozyma]